MSDAEVLQQLSERLRALEDRDAIRDVIWASTLHSDLNEGKQSLAQFSNDAVIDYSSLPGQGSACIPIREHGARLASFLPGFEKRQHRITNFQIQIDGDHATVRSQCSAIHVLEGQVWEACATYHHQLVRTDAGWKIRYLRADLLHQSGEALVDRATAIVAERRKNR